MVVSVNWLSSTAHQGQPLSRYVRPVNRYVHPITNMCVSVQLITCLLICLIMCYVCSSRICSIIMPVIIVVEIVHKNCILARQWNQIFTAPVCLTCFFQLIILYSKNFRGRKSSRISRITGYSRKYYPRMSCIC